MNTAAENFDARELAKFDAMASRWWDPEGEFKPLHQLNPLRLAFIAGHTDIRQSIALDVGCGGGLLSEALARDGAEVTGIDMAEGPLAVAKLHRQKSGLDSIRYLASTAENLAVGESGRYDIVTCMEVVEHVPDPASLLGACAALTRPGGSVFFSTLNRTPKAFLFAIVGAEYLLNMLPRGTHEYERFIRPSELRRWARDAGLEFGAIRGVSYDPFRRDFRLSDDVDVNYLMMFRKPA